jgi:uncharacterized membrane protein YhaH (DUF805 family)
MFESLIGFDGRIGRKSFWGGSCILLVATVILFVLMSMFMGPSLADMFDPEKMKDPNFYDAMMFTNALQQAITPIVFAYPVLALTGKRLSDRDHPGWMKWMFFAPAVLAAIVSLFGLDYVITGVDEYGVVTDLTLVG